MNDLAMRPPPEAGLSLIEVLVTVTVLTVVLLSTGMTLLRGYGQRRESFQAYLAANAVRDLMAEIQETANLDQDLGALEGIGAVYQRYHNQTFNVPSLPNGQIVVFCYANEATVPASLGGPQDLNFDGDAADDAGAASGTDLKLVPLRMTVTSEQDSQTLYSMVVHRLVTQTRD